MAVTKLSNGHFTGLSPDAKPTAANANYKSGAAYQPAPLPGHRFTETDTGQAYVWTGADWRPVQ